MVTPLPSDVVAKAGYHGGQKLSHKLAGPGRKKKAEKCVNAYSSKENYQINSIQVTRDEAFAAFIVEIFSLYESQIYKLTSGNAKILNYTALGRDLTRRFMEYVSRNPIQGDIRNIDDMLKAVLRGKSKKKFTKFGILSSISCIFSLIC